MNRMAGLSKKTCRGAEDSARIGAMNILFTPVRIGSVTVPNRFVCSATHDYMADDEGFVSDANVERLARLAQGEAGLIVTGHAFVQPSGKASPRQIAVYDDRFVDGLARIPSAVHRFSSKVFLQIAHAGRQTKPKLCGCVPVSPSAVYDPASKVMPRELTADEIRRLIIDFVDAAGRAKRAGFDGVQLHAAHGYLLSSFLSPHTNRRTDGWGGTVENRARVLLETLRRIHASCGRDFPVIVKLNSDDFLEGGLTVDDAVLVARRLDETGIDGIEVSGGMAEAGKGSIWPGMRSEEDEGYFVASAARVKEAVGVPVFGLGGIRTLAAAERMVAEGRVDLVSMSRPFIRDPYLVKHFREGSVMKSGCISCNKCHSLRGIRCADLTGKA
jgi:2,4-dienoyl-CoA reductase-like NADH-dependent reductase (Old Yellow Enzyme family)